METKNTAPLRACVFDRLSEVQFASEDKESDKFKIIVYSGQVIANHWYWGNLGWDLKGISFDKKVTPILEEHLKSNRIGFTTKQEITDKIVVVEGKFLSNQTAQQMKSDIREGFPMQASPHLRPTVVERIADGETTQVNGHTLKGLGTVFRKSKMKEVSMLVFGADDNTQSLAAAEDSEKEIKFNVIEKENEIMAEIETKEEITAETFAAENPVLFEKIKSEAKAEGEKEARELFGQFIEKFSNDPAFVIEQFKTGATLAAAVEAENAKLKKAAEAPEVDPAVQEFSDEQKQEKTRSSDAGDGPTTFAEAVERRVKSDNSDKTEVAKEAAATRFCVGKYPELHKKMLKEQKKND